MSTYMHNAISVLAMISMIAATAMAATMMPTIAPVGRPSVTVGVDVGVDVGVVMAVGVAWVVGSRACKLATGNPALMYVIIEFCHVDIKVKITI